jgi:hypothetical protein
VPALRHRKRVLEGNSPQFSGEAWISFLQVSQPVHNMADVVAELRGRQKAKRDLATRDGPRDVRGRQFGPRRLRLPQAIPAGEHMAQDCALEPDAVFLGGYTLALLSRKISGSFQINDANRPHISALPSPA